MLGALKLWDLGGTETVPNGSHRDGDYLVWLHAWSSNPMGIALRAEEGKLPLVSDIKLLIAPRVGFHFVFPHLLY